MKKQGQRNDTRTIFPGGQPWEFKIGRRFVSIYGPENQRFYVEKTDIEGGKKVRKYNGPLDSYTDQYSLGPAAIVNYIESKILGVEVTHKKCVSCEQIKADVYSRPNPFMLEIYSDHTNHNLCNDCVNRMAEEI